MAVSMSVSHLTSHWNIPQVMWRGNSIDLSDKTIYTTLVRTNGPMYEAGESVVTLFRKNGWQRIGLLYLEAGKFSKLKIIVKMVSLLGERFIPNA